MRYKPKRIRELIDEARAGSEEAAATLGYIHVICGFWGASFDEVAGWLKAYVRLISNTPHGQLMLAQHYLHRGRNKKERSEGLEYCLSMGLKGDEDALLDLVLAYLMGLGTQRDVTAAIQWYNRLRRDDEAFVIGLIKKLMRHVKLTDLAPETVVHVGYGIYTSYYVEEDGCVYPSVLD